METKHLTTIALAGLLIVATSAAGEPEVSFRVSVDTSQLARQPAMFALDFVDGDGDDNNTVTVSGVSTDALLGLVDLTGDAEGGLQAGRLVLGDGAFFNSAEQSTELGTRLDFDLALTTKGPGTATPDSFSFFVLDADGAPITSTDPTGADALLTVDITGAEPQPLIFESNLVTVNIGVGFEIASVTPSPEELWPPNRKLVPVNIDVELEGPDADRVRCRVVSVTADEAIDESDYELTGDLTVELRASRQGTGDGRVYTIEVGCAAGGIEKRATTDVRVPHDQGN